MQLTFPSRPPLKLDRPVLVGILNVTPDSFSDGGTYADLDAAVEHGVRMVREGAGVIDVGGESSRPGSLHVDEAEQMRRVLPVIERLREVVEVPISVDTTRAAVAAAALETGAEMLNDISAGREDEGMLSLAAERRVPLVLMHMLGKPATMQQGPRYESIVSDVCSFLLDRAKAAEGAGIDHGQIILDPGIGFGKTSWHNIHLLAHINHFVELGYPILLGASRKRFLGDLTGADAPRDRDPATAVVTAMAAAAGVKLLRVHNVAANKAALDVSNG